MTSKYEYQGETFEVSKPKDCKMLVSAKGLTAVVSIYAATNQYREDLDGWGSDRSSLDAALKGACQRILDKAARPTHKDLCADMDKFYDSLSD